MKQMRTMPHLAQSSPRTREEMTHRIGRFYSGRPSWRTRLRSLRRRLGDASLPLSEEEQLIKVRRRLATDNADVPIRALRLVRPLPPVLLAADGKTSFRYVKALKNASTSILNLLLEVTGEAAWRSWNEEEYVIGKSPFQLVAVEDDKGPAFVAINGYRLRFQHIYMKTDAFAPEPCADIRFCVVRDPVERFMSALSQIQVQRFRRAKRVSPLTPAWVDAWLDRASEFYAAADKAKPDAPPKFNMHLLRQTWFLGKDAGWYTHIFSTRRRQEFHEFLSDLAGKRLSPFDANSLVSRQNLLRARGLSLERPQLTPAQRRRVEALYAEDYRVFERWF